jgi:hypothetical protein
MDVWCLTFPVVLDMVMAHTICQLIPIFLCLCPSVSPFFLIWIFFSLFDLYFLLDFNF